MTKDTSNNSNVVVQTTSNGVTPLPVLKFYKLHPSVEIPKFATDGSACFDLSYRRGNHSEVTVYNSAGMKPAPRIRLINSDGSFRIMGGERIMIPTGLKAEIPEGYSVRVHPRSGRSIKEGLTMPNCEGVIDSDYVNEWMILLYNIGATEVTIREGDRLLQAELVRNLNYQIEETEVEPVITTRTGGFGSTGN